MYTITYKFNDRQRSINAESADAVIAWYTQAMSTPGLYSHVHVLKNVDHEFRIPEEIK